MLAFSQGEGSGRGQQGSPLRIQCRALVGILKQRLRAFFRGAHPDSSKGLEALKGRYEAKSGRQGRVQSRAEVRERGQEPEAGGCQGGK